jgi:hypothetical protein
MSPFCFNVMLLLLFVCKVMLAALSKYGTKVHTGDPEAPAISARQRKPKAASAANPALQIWTVLVGMVDSASGKISCMRWSWKVRGRWYVCQLVDDHSIVSVRLKDSTPAACEHLRIPIRTSA